MSVITVAPVVVIPDIDSKNASVILSPESEIYRGIAENIAIRSQVSEIKINASRSPSNWFFPHTDNTKINPVIAVISDDNIKTL
tara:strand:+ start:43 stop:294 length:252 start_codon:yes stop_codon:yes gene_type:complete